MRIYYLLVLGAFCAAAFAQTPRSSKPEFSAIRQQLRAHVGGDDVPGLAVAVSRGDEILWEEGFGWADREKHIPATSTAPFYVASITKSLTATAVLHLAERGKLQLDDPVNRYLGAEKIHSPAWDASGATIRRVLSHTSGLTTFSRWCSTTSDPHCDIDSEIERYGLLVWPPGELFDYSNLGYGILGDVVARVSSKSLDAYLQTQIFRPLNMRDCAIVLHGPAAKRAAAQYDEKTHARSPARVTGHEGASGLHCSARDLLSFGMFNLKRHVGRDAPLNGHDIDEMHTAQSGTRGQYGLGWWIRQQSGSEIIFAQGGTSDAYALLELIPAKGIAIVVVANSYSQLVSGLDRQIVSVLAPELAPEQQASAPRPAQPSPAPAALAGRWSGQFLTYKGPVKVTLDVAADGSAQGQIDDGPVATVTNVSLRPRHIYGQLLGEPGLPDAPNRLFMIELDLGLQGDKLIGAATFGPLRDEGGDGDQLPHFVSLARVP
jgi:CubicO group peptidase (beta-lactamase class C family)